MLKNARLYFINSLLKIGRAFYFFNTPIEVKKVYSFIVASVIGLWQDFKTIITIKDVQIISASILLLFVHLFFSDNRTSWYIRVLCKDISFLLMVYYIYTKIGKIKFKHAFNFFAVKLSFCIIDTILGFFNIHVHASILKIQYVPLAYIVLSAYYGWKNGD